MAWAWNPSDKSANISLSGSDLVATGALNTDSNIRGDTPVGGGKKYFELDFAFASTNYCGVGLATDDVALDTWIGSNSHNSGVATYRQTTIWDYRGLPSGEAPGFGDGAHLGIAVDDDAKLIWLTPDGSTWYGDTDTGNPAAGTGSFDYSLIADEVIYPIVGLGNGDRVTAVPDAASWIYSPPSGFGEIGAAGAGEITGALAATEGADVAAIAGAVLVQGALAATEGADAAAMTGGVLAQGALAATEGADAAALTGVVRVQGALAATEGADAAALAGNVRVAGALAAVEGADAAALAGTVLVQGALAGVEGADAASFAGIVTGVAEGEISAVEGADTAAFAGTVLVSGALAAVEGADAAAFTGTAAIYGALAAVEGADAAAFAGDVLVMGSLSATEGADACNATGAVLVQGSLAATEGADAASFSGLVYNSEVTGTLEAVEGADSASFTSRPEQQEFIGGGVTRPFRRRPQPIFERIEIRAVAASGQGRQGVAARGDVAIVVQGKSLQMDARVQADVEMELAFAAVQSQVQGHRRSGYRMAMTARGASGQPVSGIDVETDLAVRIKVKSGGESAPVPEYFGDLEPFEPMSEAA